MLCFILKLENVELAKALEAQPQGSYSCKCTETEAPPAIGDSIATNALDYAFRVSCNINFVVRAIERLAERP
jgi:hypothetical protein